MLNNHFVLGAPYSVHAGGFMAGTGLAYVKAVLVG
jgi:hypothetical protein